MRHATVYATEVLMNGREVATEHGLQFIAPESWLHASDISCCDWQRSSENSFRSQEAVLMLRGDKVQLPTCPACAALVDLALELRGS